MFGWKFWHRYQERVRERVRRTHLSRLLGERLFRNYLWVHDKRAIAGGLTLGVFIAFTPTIPFQMLLAACGALYFRVNLPIALAACWITNPVTAVPIYLYAWRLGTFVLEEVVLIEELFDFYPLGSRMGSVVAQSAYLWAGSLIFATCAALIANLSVRALWSLLSCAIASKYRRPPPGR